MSTERRLAKATPLSSGRSEQTDNNVASGQSRKGAGTVLPLWIDWRRASMEDIKVIKEDVQQNRNA